MNNSWSNTDHITQSDWDEHQAALNLYRLQERIYDLKTRREEPRIKTFYIDNQADVVDILQAILDGNLEELELEEGSDEEDLS
jgi:SepF-like predicted cell division protein (DUF552 family)